MKKYKLLKYFIQNKFNKFLGKELKIPFDKNIFQRNKLYQKTKLKIYNLSQKTRDIIKSLKVNNQSIVIRKDFSFISIYFAENQLKISRNIENKNKIIIKKNITLRIPNNVVDGDKVLDLDTLVKIIGDIISVIGDSKIPILLNLNSKYFILKTFGKQEFALTKNKNQKILSNSPFIENNTSIREKENIVKNSMESTVVVYSKKEVIQSWVNVLSKVENPKICISNGYLEIIHSLLNTDINLKSLIVVDVGAFSTTLFIKDNEFFLSSLNLPFGSDLYKSESDEIRIQYFNRLRNSIDNLIKENNMSSNIKVYICGIGLNLIKKDDEILPNNLIELSTLFKEKIENSENEVSDFSSNYNFHTLSYGLIKNKNNLTFNFLDNYSSIYRWNPNKEINENINDLNKFSSFSKNLKKIYSEIKKQKILIYPTGSVILITLIFWLITLPSFLTTIRLKNNHLKYQANIDELRLTRIFIEENIDNIISLSSLYRSNSPAYLFANFLQQSIPIDIRISNYLLNKSGFRIEFISKNIDDINKLIKLLSGIPLIEKDSLSIKYIRTKTINSKSTLELTGKFTNLTLQERLKFNSEFGNFGKYSKLNLFSDINKIFGD